MDLTSDRVTAAVREYPDVQPLATVEAEHLEMLPETPPTHETIVDHNRQARTPETDLADLEAGANRCAAG
jgi:hypothetical protein